MSRFGNLNDPFVIQQQRERSEDMARIVAELRAKQDAAECIGEALNVEHLAPARHITFTVLPSGHGEW